MRHLSIALLVAACTALPAWADAPSETDRARAQALMAEGTAAAERSDAATALRLFGEATHLLRDADRAHQLGHLYERQRELPDRETQANRWFTFAAELGHAESMEHMGERYVYGRNGIARDVNRGIELLIAAEKAADSDNDGPEVGGVLSRFRKEQEDKARCMLAALRERGMDEAPFSAGTLYDVHDGEGADASGDAFEVGGLQQWGTNAASLEVNGFDGRSGSYHRDTFIASGTYTATTPSRAGRDLARAVRERCGVDE